MAALVVEGAEVTIPVIEIDVIMVTATGIRTMDPEVTADNTIAIGVIIGITDVTGIIDLSRPTEGTIPIKVETTIIEAVTGIRTMDPLLIFFLLKLSVLYVSIAYGIYPNMYYVIVGKMEIFTAFFFLEFMKKNPF